MKLLLACDQCMIEHLGRLPETLSKNFVSFNVDLMQIRRWNPTKNAIERTDKNLYLYAHSEIVRYAG